jgi:hypothetical protein
LNHFSALLGIPFRFGTRSSRSRYLKEIAATDAYRKALDDEKPFIANMGLDRRFLDTA